MTPGGFDQVLESRLEKIRTVLASKGREYASDTDRLHNFKRAAGITGESRWQVCVGFMAKHLASVFDLVEARTRGAAVDPAVLDEKIGDAVNYLILLEALFLEVDRG